MGLRRGYLMICDLGVSIFTKHIMIQVLNIVICIQISMDFFQLLVMELREEIKWESRI